MLHTLVVVYMYMQLHVLVFTCTCYRHVYVCTCSYIYMYMQLHLHVYVYVVTSTCVCTCSYIYMYMYICCPYRNRQTLLNRQSPLLTDVLYSYRNPLVSIISLYRNILSSCTCTLRLLCYIYTQRVMNVLYTVLHFKQIYIYMYIYMYMYTCM